MRWFILFTFSFPLFAGSFKELIPSTPEEIASLTTDLLVAGFVSVTSGQLALSEIDLRVRGAQDHYHRQVPNGKGGYNYVDGEGIPVTPGSNQAHLYPNIIR
jgi:hypothetical protein